jgi:hypothetical protein
VHETRSKPRRTIVGKDWTWKNIKWEHTMNIKLRVGCSFPMADLAWKTCHQAWPTAPAWHRRRSSCYLWPNSGDLDKCCFASRVSSNKKSGWLALTLGCMCDFKGASTSGWVPLLSWNGMARAKGHGNDHANPPFQVQLLDVPKLKATSTANYIKILSCVLS